MENKGFLWDQRQSMAHTDHRPPRWPCGLRVNAPREFYRLTHPWAIHGFCDILCHIHELTI